MVATFERIAGPPLRLLTRLGGSSLLDRFELRKPVEQVVARAAQAVVQAATPKRDPSRLGAPPKAELFDLTPTDEQDLMIQTARRFADDVLRPPAHDADEACETPASVQTKSGDLGLAAMVIPEAHGGVAETRSLVTSALTAIELARGDLSLAFALLAPVAAVDALVRYGSAAQQAKWLPRFASQAFVPAALALLEAKPGFDPLRPQTGAVRSSDGWKLYGEKALVPHGASAEILVVVGEVRGAGARLFLVERGPDVIVSPEPAMGLRAAATARVRFDGAPCEMVGDAIDLEDLVARARVMWAALACGTGRAVLDHCKQYVNDRRAFGEPISNRQSVAFAVADIAIELEGMRLLMLRAAALADRGHDGFARVAQLARIQAASKGMRIGSDGVQLLGGHGYTKEHPVERWYRDLRAIGIMEGAL